eukprot:2190864-Amphidinium_carterae.1
MATLKNGMQWKRVNRMSKKEKTAQCTFDHEEAAVVFQYGLVMALFASSPLQAEDSAGKCVRKDLLFQQVTSPSSTNIIADVLSPG